MTVTSHDVARRAGVSQATVSRALRDDPRVQPGTRERVRTAAAELGYVPSELGRSLSTSATRQIAMVADLDNALYPTLVAPLHDRFAEHGFRMVLLAERGDDRATYTRLLDRSVDGVVLTTTLVRSSLSRSLRDQGMPFVELNRVSGLSGVDGISADNTGGAARCAELLVAAGHTRIAAAFGAADTSTGRERETGFRRALDAAAVPLPDRRVVRAELTADGGSAAFGRLMTGRYPPTAVFCASDAVAVGVVNEAARRGLRVPDDLSVVGFDDLDIAGWPWFRLTTVHVDLPGMARAAADRLVERIAGAQDRARRRTFPVALVLRDSVRPR